MVFFKGTLWDKNRVRYQLAKEPSGQELNMLVLPGGPGMDSSYLYELVSQLDISGNIWLVDFPGNGSNEPDFTAFDAWFDFIVDAAKLFRNVIILGHSFGGIISLLSPLLENDLKGLILLNSTPKNWMPAVQESMHTKHLPDLTMQKQAYVNTPTDENMRAYFLASAPYFFLPDMLDKGTELLRTLPCNFNALNWFNKKVEKEDYTAKWIPQRVPTLILSGSEDAITPPRFFTEDKRFARDNISHFILEGCSHFSWLDAPDKVCAHIESFYHQQFRSHLD